MRDGAGKDDVLSAASQGRWRAWLRSELRETVR